MKLLKDFKTFAMRGNVIDMAVGIIIGAAFGKIVASFVNDVIMPPIGLPIGGGDFSNISLVIKEATASSKAVTVNCGIFINTVINFLIIAWAIFTVIKGMNALRKKEQVKPVEPPKPSQEVVLLSEISDLLKK